MAEISHRGMICTKCGFQWEETRGTISACPACQSTFVEAETDWSAIEEAPNPPTKPQPLYPPEEENNPKSSESSSPPTEIDEYRPGGGADQYCTSCGNKRSSEDVFCGRCGVRLNKLTVQDTQLVERSSPEASNQTISASQVASPVKRPNPRGIGVKLLSALLYAFICFVIGELVAIIVMVVKGGTIPPEWYLLLFIFILFGGYKGFTKVPRK